MTTLALAILPDRPPVDTTVVQLHDQAVLSAHRLDDGRPVLRIGNLGGAVEFELADPDQVTPLLRDLIAATGQTPIMLPVAPRRLREEVA